jgi:hypothetical protein
MTISRNKAKQPKQIDLVLPKHPATAHRAVQCFAPETDQMPEMAYSFSNPSPSSLLRSLIDTVSPASSIAPASISTFFVREK